METWEGYCSICATSVCFEAHGPDRKSTRLNSSHSQISYAVFCLKKKKLFAVRVRRRPSTFKPRPLDPPDCSHCQTELPLLLCSMTPRIDASRDTPAPLWCLVVWT